MWIVCLSISLYLRIYLPVPPLLIPLLSLCLHHSMSLYLRIYLPIPPLLIPLLSLCLHHSSSHVTTTLPPFTYVSTTLTSVSVCHHHSPSLPMSLLHSSSPCISLSPSIALCVYPSPSIPTTLPFSLILPVSLPNCQNHFKQHSYFDSKILKAKKQQKTEKNRGVNVGCGETIVEFCSLTFQCQTFY